MFDLNWRSQGVHWGTGANLGEDFGDEVGEDKEEVKEEEGEEEGKEEGGLGTAKGVDGGVTKAADCNFTGVSFDFIFLILGWIMSMYLLLYSEVADPLMLCAFLKCFTSTR